MPDFSQAKSLVENTRRYGLESLTLARMGLTDEQAAALDLGSLPWLAKLDLTGNRLTQLPAGVDRMEELIWLGLNFNQIGSLEGLGAKPNLERLICGEIDWKLCRKTLAHGSRPWRSWI